jgi:hypothetical protein
MGVPPQQQPPPTHLRSPCCIPLTLQMGYYDRSKDVTLLRAFRQCSAREKQWNATLCQSTVLTAY